MQVQTENKKTAPSRAVTKKLSLTERKLAQLLHENTGRSMLDSGGAYGRNWECNQNRNFDSETAAILSVREYSGRPEIEVTLNVFHWLRERVTYNARLTAAFNRFSKRNDNKGAHWLDLMEAFAEERSAPGERARTTNTYNGEDLLAQVLQYTVWTDDDGAHALIQIHGGCDVRGGYTAPAVFDIEDTYTLYDNDSATIYEDHTTRVDQPALPGIEREDDPAYWCTDDACHWYAEGACGLGAKPQLETYETTHDPAERGHGKIYLDDDGTAYGPIYGGRLYASF